MQTFALHILFQVFIPLAVQGFSHKSIYPKLKNASPPLNFEDVGEPLILTPLIQAGKIEKARKLSRVTNFTSIESYSGYFTVNETYNSNMFFWFFPAAVSKTYFLGTKSDL